MVIMTTARDVTERTGITSDIYDTIDKIYLAFDSVNVFVFAAVFVGNVLVISSVAKYKRLQTVSNAFLVNLAVADLTVGTAALLCSIRNLGLKTRHALSRAECVSCAGAPIFASGSSLFAVILVSAERFVKIVCTEKYEDVFRRRRVLLLILTPWVLTAMAAAALFIWNTYYEGMFCHLRLVAPKIYKIVVMNGFLTMAILTIVCLYCAIVYKVVQHQRQVASSLARGQRENWSSGNRRMNTVVLLIVGILLIALVPYICVGFMTPSDSIIYHALGVVSSICMNCTSFVNPVIYAWKIPEFRTAFKAVLTCKGQLVFEDIR